MGWGGIKQLNPRNQRNQKEKGSAPYDCTRIIKMPVNNRLSSIIYRIMC